MANLIPLEYRVDYPHISVICEDFHKKKIAFSINASGLTEEEAWGMLDKKVNEINAMKSENEIRNMTMKEYAHYRQIYFADNDVRGYSPLNGILYDKQPGYISPSRKPFTKSVEPRTSGNPFDYPKPIIPAAKQTVIESPKNYYHYYWAFVNAENQDGADAALDSMINMVTLDLQPRADGKSWADDPRPTGVSKEFTETKTIKFLRSKPSPWEPIVAMFFGAAIFGVLHLFGVL